MKNYKKAFAVFFSLWFGINSGPLIAQEKPSDYKNKFEDEYYVRLQDYRFTKIEIAKEGLNIENRFFQKSIYVDKAAIDHGSSSSIEYSPPFTSIKDISAYSLVPQEKGDKYVKEKVKTVTDKEVMSDRIFYGGNRAKLYTFPGLREGTITVLEYTEEVHEPKFNGSAMFTGFGLVEDQKFELRIDKNVELDIKYYNCTEEFFNYTKEEKGGELIYTWSPKDYKKITSEDEMPEYLRVVPHIVYRIVAYQQDGQTKPVLRDTKDLYDWYASLIVDANNDTDEDLQKLTDSIVKGLDSQDEKARHIFEWVQSNIKYIAFEDGLGGFKPRLPTEVLNKRYGDCKDMSCLTVNMLNYAGVSAYHTWIGTRRIPYTYQDVPSPLADNHMIVAAKVDGEYIFLDPTNSDLPYPLPSAFTQGKEALIGIDSNNFIIETVPVIPSSLSVIYDTVTVRLHDLVVEGEGKRSYTGYYADVINGALHDNNQEDIEKRLKYHVQKGNNKCIADSFDIAKNKDHTVVSYDFSVPDYAFEQGDEIFINLNLEKIMSSYKLKKDRVHPVKYNFAYKLVRYYTFQIPEGYKLGYVPENQGVEFKDFSYQLHYDKGANTLNYTLTIDINTIEIEPENFADWNTLISKLNQSYNTSISIIKK